VRDGDFDPEIVHESLQVLLEEVLRCRVAAAAIAQPQDRGRLAIGADPVPVPAKTSGTRLRRLFPCLIAPCGTLHETHPKWLANDEAAQCDFLGVRQVTELYPGVASITPASGAGETHVVSLAWWPEDDLDLVTRLQIIWHM
jgi:hypothetical protein